MLLEECVLCGAFEVDGDAQPAAEPATVVIERDSFVKFILGELFTER